MKFLFFAAAALVPSALLAEEIFLTCQVTQIAASEAEGKTDTKLKKIAKFLAKDEAMKKYHNFRFAGKKSLSATKDKSGSAKLKNGETLTVRAVSVSRAQKKNTVTVDLSVGSSSSQKSFVDREYLIVPAGQLDKKTDLVAALHCPVFP